jgi:hypothetical protein
MGSPLDPETHSALAVDAERVSANHLEPRVHATTTRK